MTRNILSFRSIATGLLTVGVLVLGAINIHQQGEWLTPVDGGAWIESDRGIEARSITKDGPADRAGIRRGDILKAIGGRTVTNDRQVTKVLYDLGVWSKATYTVERNGVVLELPLVVSAESDRVLWQRFYAEIIGLLYFLVGIFVLLRRARAHHAFHFYLVCLTSFVLYAFHYTGKLNGFDQTIFWFNLIAYVFLPPMFLHFALEFSRSPGPSVRRLLWRALLYLPGVALLLVWLSFVYRVLGFAGSPLAFRNLLENLTDFYFGACFVLSAAVLYRTYRTAQTPELRQQMKWVTRGTALAVLPYFFFQSIPRILGMTPGLLGDLAIFPLALIPLSFGYAIHSYRLMDVDIIFKRGVKWTLATASVLGLYATIVALVGELLPVNTFARVAATILAALLFAPIKDQFQVWLDKFFYRDRYDVRQTLIDFGRTLGSEVNLERMLEKIVDRLGRALLVERAAVFMENPPASGQFHVVLASGTTIPASADLTFLRASEERHFIFFESAVHGLNYFIPCRVKDRAIAYVGLSRTKKGDYLSSEDIDLLETVSDYIGIALENARLYRSLEEEAGEYQNLKDFNENIIESINVGVVVEDDHGRVVVWNKALEEMTGQRRGSTLGKRTEELIPAQFVARLENHRHLYKQIWNGLTVNFSATSLLDKAGATRGRLIIIADITERVRLENQLVQNDKLTSIGLLAAGVAHEVNTPLAVISSYSQMLRKEISPEDPRFKLLEKITSQTFRASEIISSLLSFSRTNSTEFAEIDIHQAIRDTLSLVDHQLKNAGIQVQLSLVAEYPQVFGNAGRLQQVFLNLFLNAKDAMTEGGFLRVSTQSVDSKIEIIVEDTGTGISSEHIMRIYDPFFTTKTAGKGTGLGLSVSYGIVQEHGGNVVVESKVGEGTAFRLEFPLSRKPVSV